jgi:hypothetical protein
VKEAKVVVLHEKEQRGEACEFWKMVYKIIGCKPFFVILQRFFRSTEVIFHLTSILQRNKHLQI